jgi:hypothetical protein
MDIHLQLDPQHTEQLNYIRQKENLEIETLFNQAIEERYDRLQSSESDGRSLFWSKTAYEYITRQGNLFDAALPQLAIQYPEMYVLFEDGQVIDADVDEDALLDRMWENDFVKSRVEKYQAIFCHFVPGLSINNT